MLKSFSQIWFALYLSVLSLSAAEPVSLFRSQIWQTEDGLPRNSVQAICQTKDGFLWVGTAAGLARFDGIDFDVFPVAPAPDNFPSVSALCGDAAGGLWVGTGAQGLFYYKDGRWSSPTFTNNLITCVREAQDRTVWIGTRSGLWRQESGTFSMFNGFEPLTTNYIRSLFEDEKGKLWVSYSVGLACIDSGQFQTNYPAQGSFPDPLIRTAIKDRRGVLWVGTRNGLNRFGNRVTTYFKKEGLPDNIVSALHEDRRGILWVGTFGGLARREDGTFVTETTRDGDALDQVFCFYEDHEGNVWAGTKEGLFRFTPQHCQTITRRNGLAHNNVITVLPSRMGDVWAGTWGGGLHEVTHGKVVTHLNRTAFDVMRNDLILALCQRRGGGVWFGTDFGGGLYEARRGKGGNWRCQRYDATNGTSITSIRAISYDAKTNLWVGTTLGLFQFDGQALVPAFVSGDKTAVSVRCFLDARDGSFWIGTEQGLVCWTETQTNLFTTADGLSDNRILSLHEDGQSTLWIGTATGGLNRLRHDANGEIPTSDRSRPTFTSYSTEDGLHNNTVLEILESKDGFLWMSSYHGLSCVPKIELLNHVRGVSPALRCLTFGQEDGMDSPVCVGAAKPSGCRTEDGRLWFPTTKGLVVVNPEIPWNEKSPPVVIRRVLADRKEVGVHTGAKDKSLNSSADIEIPPGRGELEIQFSALSFQSPGKNRYKYKLEGIDADWVQSTPQRTATYHNLKPGRYSFHVIACNNHGVWNKEGASVTIQWQPHFWQTLQFKLMMAGAFGLVLFGVDRVRVARLRDLERLRLRIAADLHDEVGSNLGSVSMLARLLGKSKTMSAEERKDVALIERVTAETANAVKDIVWFTNPGYDTMQDMLMRMKDTASTMLTGLDCQFESRVEHITAHLSLEFRKNFFLIFKETLANVVKHSYATRVEIALTEQNNKWELRISDNGVGFAITAPSQGNGLKNLRDRAAAIGATLNVQTLPGKGTTVILIVRVP